MPFTIGGDWVPKKESSVKSEKKPVVIRIEKRKNKLTTKIYHLPLDTRQMKDLLSELKKKLAVGGTLKEGVIEIQGDKLKELTLELRAKELIK